MRYSLSFANPPSYVQCISDSLVTVVCRDKSTVGLLRSLGAKSFSLTLENWLMMYEGPEELAAVLSRMRDCGVAMAGAPYGWSPSAVFMHLRDKGLLTSEFIEIEWGVQRSERLYRR